MAAGAARAWSAEDDARLRELYAQELSLTAIGRAMGKTKNAVVGRSHRLGLPARPSPIGGNRIEVTAETAAAIRRDGMHGYSIREASQRAGVSESTVRRVFREISRPAWGRERATDGARTEGVRPLAARGAAALARAQAKAPAATPRQYGRGAGGVSSLGAAGPTIPAQAGDPRAAVPAHVPGHVFQGSVSSLTAPPAAPSAPAAAFSGRDARGCRWPLWGADDEISHLYCAEPVRAKHDGSACVYCAGHAARAFAVAEPGRKPLSWHRSGAWV